MLNKTVEDLERIYMEATEVDQQVYAEMRTNILLNSGDHYSTRKRDRNFLGNYRTQGKSNQPEKLRLVKNHIYRICRNYSKSILSKAPGIQVLPANEDQMQDRKDAEQHKKICVAIDHDYKMKERIRHWVDDYVTIGEVATKIFWDSNRGRLMGYEQKLTEDKEPVFVDPQGNETLDAVTIDLATGQQIPNREAPDTSLPVYSGGLVFEEIFAFNLFRAPGAKNMDDSPYIGIRKMMSLAELKHIYAENEEVRTKLEKTTDTDYIVFETNRAEYEQKDKYALIKECYWKPSKMHPNGYYFIWIDTVILEQGELPYGLFPIHWKPFDKYPTKCRGTSIIKIARPFQVEINRSASQRATHGITTADDKILYSSGSKLAPGGLLPGVRGISYTGMPPTILPGRTGDQFASYIKDEKLELYEATMLNEEMGDTQMNLDPYTLLFRTIGQQAKYEKYIEQFGEFLIDVYEYVLKVLRVYLPDDDLIEILGPSERGNIAEFRKHTPSKYRIKLQTVDNTFDTLLGKQLQYNHILQYSGGQLAPDQLGMIFKNLPFGNNEEIFSDLTVDYENAKNDMLAMERGEEVQMSPFTNNEYLAKKLANRMKQPDFKFLDPQIQQAYYTYMEQNQLEIQRKEQEALQAKDEYIPIGGASITCSMKVPGPGGRPKQLILPYQSLQWLMQQLERQGASLDNLEAMRESGISPIQKTPQTQWSAMADEGTEATNQVILQNQGII